MDYLNLIGIERWSLRNDRSNNLGVSEGSSSAVKQASQEPSLPYSDALVDTVVEQANVSDKGFESWQDYSDKFNNAKLCPNCGPQQSVLGQGDKQAKWVFLVLSPESIASQRILDGRSHQLFQNILSALGLEIGDVYQSCVYKCDPNIPKACCDQFLHQELDLLEPQNIVCFGEKVGSLVLRSNSTLHQMQGRVHELKGSSVIITHDLREVLNKPSLKADLWRELQRLISIH